MRSGNETCTSAGAATAGGLVSVANACAVATGSAPRRTRSGNVTATSGDVRSGCGASANQPASAAGDRAVRSGNVTATRGAVRSGCGASAKACGACVGTRAARSGNVTRTGVGTAASGGPTNAWWCAVQTPGRPIRSGNAAGTIALSGCAGSAVACWSATANRGRATASGNVASPLPLTSGSCTARRNERSRSTLRYPSTLSLFPPGELWRIARRGRRGAVHHEIDQCRLLRPDDHRRQ